MAVVAAVAAALAALASVVATGGFALGPRTVGPLAYGLALLPGVVAVASGRWPETPIPTALPPRARPLLKYAGLGAALLVMSADRLPDGTGTAVTTAAVLAAAGAAVWWPRPAFVRASVGLAAVGLARPGADAMAHLPALAGLAAASAVALVAANRLAPAGTAALGGVRRKPRPSRVAGEATVVVAALLLAAVLASRMDAQRPQPQQPERGARPLHEEPAPLAYQDALDPDRAGPDRRGDPDEILLRVDADRAGVLRAVTYDRWDGRRWRRSEFLDGGPVVSARHAPVFAEAFESVPTAVSEQRVRVEAPYAGVAVGTPRVYYYDLPVGGRTAADGTVQLVPAVGKGAVYTAQSGRVDVSSDRLRTATSGFGQEGQARPGPDPGIPAADRQRLDPNFVADPGVSTQARALAERVTSTARSDYDKVAALTAYLDATVAVDDDLPALAPDADPVDSVLFGARAATPERLATTLALLTRVLGIPSRLATGFLPGTRPFFGGEFAVRAGDAHAWVEVPFTGIGWQRFDPTGRIAEAERQDSLRERFRRAWDRYWPLVVLVAAAVAADVVRRLVSRRRRRAAQPWVTRYFARLARVGAARGRPRRPAETPAEYTAALASGVLADERLVEVGRVVTAAAWSGRQPSRAAQEWAEQVLEEAARSTRRRRRRHRAEPRVTTSR
ncbi:MAG TPA: transglutaminase domain-containing protein [Acidimicrobiales bacterium]|nr:transglutaminase domain-containing protein [Acidimicrobiales bacterium]